MLLLTAGLAGEPVSVFSPYRHWVTPGEFLQGAAIDAGRPYDLSRMRRQFNINTVNAYGVTAATVRPLMTAAAAVGMRVVVRLEEYDPVTFAFSDADASGLVKRYAPVLAGLKAGTVAYLVVNMPVDDPRVRAKERQVAYSEEVVAQLRRAAPGFPIFLGLFYGWDGSYQVPSYASAEPDGYVLTNYSYPPGDRKHIATASSSDDDLLDTRRLQKALDRVPENTPIVVEYGFQTLAFQHGRWPSQTAGLVADQAAKQRAMQATTAFYRAHYRQVIGTMYFGYDFVKPEGDPPRPADWALTGLG